MRVRTANKWDMLEVIQSQLSSPLLQGTFGRFDANETLAFAEELKAVFAETYKVEYPALMARTIIPASSPIGNWARSHAYRQYEGFGEAKISDDLATDFPSVELKGTEFLGTVKSLVQSYQYDIQDLREAAKLGFPLDAEKAALARESIETKVDSLAAFGDTVTGLKGFVNAANIIPVTKVSAGSTWQDVLATPEEILKDLLAISQASFVTTNGLHQANEIAVGTKGYTKLAYSRLNTYSDKSLLQYCLENLPGIKNIVHWPLLNIGSTGAAGGVERIMAYEKNPRNFSLVEPQPFEQFPPQVRGLAFVINCHERFGGVKIPKPKSIVYMDGTEP